MFKLDIKYCHKRTCIFGWSYVRGVGRGGFNVNMKGVALFVGIHRDIRSASRRVSRPK